MAELFPVSIGDQIACVEREIAMRHKVYARRVAERTMSQTRADAEVAAMVAVLATLRTVAEWREMPT